MARVPTTIDYIAFLPHHQFLRPSGILLLLYLFAELSGVHTNYTASKLTSTTPTSSSEKFALPDRNWGERTILSGNFSNPQFYTINGAAPWSKNKDNSSTSFLTTYGLTPEIDDTVNRTISLDTTATSSAAQKVEDIKMFFNNRSYVDYTLTGDKKLRLYGMFGDAYISVYSWTWTILVPEEFRFVYLLITMPEDPCIGSYGVTILPSSEYTGYEGLTFDCQFRFRQLFFSVKHSQAFYLSYRNGARTRVFMPDYTIAAPNITMEYVAYKEDVRTRLVVTFETADSGHISQWGFDGMKYYLCVNNASYTLALPEDHVVMLSFSHFDMHFLLNDCPYAGLWLYSADKTGNKSLIIHRCGELNIPAQIYFTSLLFHFKTQKFCTRGGIGFKALFSFHSTSQKPQKLEKSLFNCSTPNFHTFKKHLECNLNYECDGEEDEGEHCPYSNARCKGLVASGRKCYSYVSLDRNVPFDTARLECLTRGGDLAMMKTQSEWNDFKQMFQYGNNFKNAWFGARSGDNSFPDTYKYMLKWVDKSIVQTVSIYPYAKLRISYIRERESCAYISVGQKILIEYEKCVDRSFAHFYCQYVSTRIKTSNTAFPVISFPYPFVNKTNLRMVMCENDQAAHAFLFCDFESHCNFHEKYFQECRLPSDVGHSNNFVVGMFECEDATMTLHYTLVCDFRQDCRDGSDETFCAHEICAGFQCDNGQCVEKDQRCDSDRDCLDESDELLCDNELQSFDIVFLVPHVVRLPPPVSIDFNSKRYVIQKPMNGSELCENTHFQCIERYCLPVYLYCNDVVDCPDGEDERDCHLHTCPGFYRCRSSSVCVHADHLCDGLPQCPQRDDEWLCDVTCPESCLCQGHAFLCGQYFNPAAQPYLRYLDASGSSMKVEDIKGVVLLMWLSLAQCGVHQMSEMNLPNLRTLDLGHNLLTSIHMEVFMPLTNLKTLILCRNPIVHLSAETTSQNHTRLQTVDLSWTSLKTFNSKVVSSFPHITNLNISFSKINSIHDYGFSGIPRLKQVDLRGNALSAYPNDLLRQLLGLQSLYTDDFRLCCQQSLPHTFTSERECISPNTNSSSCTDLLRYFVHRVMMWVFMFLATIGNMAWIVFKVCIRRNALSSSLDFLMTNLSLMDLLMGVYTTVIAAMDWKYRQRYFSFRNMWISSFTCKMSSFLALLSYEATLFTLCFITVHSFITTYSHRLSIKVTPRRVYMVSIVIWALAILISLVPLLMSDWRLHGHTDSCLAVPTAVNNVAGRSYALAVMVVLHFVICSLTCVGQLSVLWVKYFHDDLTLSITERSLKTTEATRSFPIITLDTVRRLVFFLLIGMGQIGWLTVHQIQTVYSVFVVPTNSAINPLLYVLSCLYEKRRLVAEQRLLQRLARKLVHQRNM